jgi:metal-sulfur cluster biosynthetic enzyme
MTFLSAGSLTLPVTGLGADVIELTLLTVPACPGAPVFEERLAAALAGYPGAVVRRVEVATGSILDQARAEQLGAETFGSLLDGTG